jgi:hypothetical protein
VLGISSPPVFVPKCVVCGIVSLAVTAHLKMDGSLLCDGSSMAFNFFTGCCFVVDKT